MLWDSFSRAITQWGSTITLTRVHTVTEPVGVAEWIFPDRLPFKAIGESKGHRFKSGPQSFEHSSSQTNDFKIDTYHCLAWCLAVLRAGLSVRIMRLSGTADHGTSSLMPQSGSTIKLPWVHTDTSWYPSPHQSCPTTVKHSFISHQITREL